MIVGRINKMVSEIHQRGDGAKNTWNALSGVGSKAVFEQFIEGATADGNPNRLVEALLSESISDKRMEDRMVRQLLLKRLNSEQRMKFFLGEITPQPADPMVAEQLRAELGGLGHSPEEIDRMLKPKKRR